MAYLKEVINNYPKLLLFVITFLLYANTLGHSYTQDDNILIQNNIFTHQGIGGLKGVFTYDTFYGHFVDSEDTKTMVAGGRYRPITHAMFAIEYEFFGMNPFWGHLVNVLLYSLLVVLIFSALRYMLKPRLGEKAGFKLFIFLATLIYAIHPIHIECISNIKGRDEIMSMMGAIGTLFLVLKWVDTSKIIYLILSSIVFFLGLLSKENTITFLAVIPAALYCFRSIKAKDYILPAVVLGITTILFLYVRFSILGWSLGEESTNVLNNPFLKEIEGNEWIPFSAMEKFATIMYTLGKYLIMLFVPHPLTYDYYPKHITMHTFNDLFVLLSMAAHVGIGLMAVIALVKKKIVGFASFYYIATLSIVSNLVFPIGTFMSERFVFMPSLAFAMVIAYAWWTYGYQRKYHVVTGLIALWLLLFCVKTVDRNKDWKDNFTLFTTDVKVSKNSAKGNSAAGAQILQRCEIMDKGPEREKLYHRGIKHLRKAQELVQGNWASTMIEGYLHNQEGHYENAALAFEKAYSLDTTRVTAKNSLAAALRDAAKHEGEIGGDINKTERFLLAANNLFPNEFETTRLLGVLYTSKKQYPLAVEYFQKYALMKQDDPMAIMNLSDAHYLNRNDREAERIRQVAVSMDPELARMPIPIRK